MTFGRAVFALLDLAPTDYHANEMISRLVTATVYAGIGALFWVYAPVFEDLVEKYGVLHLTPLLTLLLVGLICSVEWLHDRVNRMSPAPIEVHNAHFPAPAVRVTGWDDWLMANDETLGVAIAALEKNKDGVLGIIQQGGLELTAALEKKGWAITVLSREERTRRIAVPHDSGWADKELHISGWRDMFKSFPKGWIDDASAREVLSSFLAQSPPSPSAAWSLVRYTN